MPFYTYNQNNSFGRFEVDNNVAHFVIIEAPSASEANTIAKDIGIYFNGVDAGIDCKCCGDRWYEATCWSEISSWPTIYGIDPTQYLASAGGLYDSVHIYYADGRHVSLNYKEETSHAAI